MDDLTALAAMSDKQLFTVMNGNPDLSGSAQEQLVARGYNFDLASTEPNPNVLKVVPLGPNKSLVAAYAGDGGFDLESASEQATVIGPNETMLIPCGFKMQLPEGYAGLVLARSSVAGQRGLAPINAPGLIDPGYRGEVAVLLHNFGMTRQVVMFGERIAQLLIVPFLAPTIAFVSELDESERGDKGFGSSGS